MMDAKVHLNTVTGQLAAALREAINVQGTIGAAVADQHGLPIASEFRHKIDLPTASAMTAMLVDAAVEAFRGFGYEDFRSAILEGGQFKMLIVRVGSGRANLLVVLEPGANLGLVRIQAEHAAMEISEILDI